MNFAVMDWNENMSRPSTSERLYVDLRRPDRRTPRRLLIQKTYGYVGTVWAMYVERNRSTERLSSTEPDDPMDDEEENEEVGDGDILDSDDDMDHEDIIGE
jgi:hypothetical protein